MAILTSSGVATFNATSNMNVRVTWSERFDTNTISSSKPYGTSTITISKVEALSKNYYGYSFYPSFWLKFNGVEVYQFTSSLAEQYVRLNSRDTWGTIVNSDNGSTFTTSFTYNRTGVSESQNFTITKATRDGWTYPCFYIYGSSTSYTNIGGGAATWTASATLATSYTNPSAPSAIYISTISGSSIKTGNYYYYKDGGAARLYWPAGAAGTNNAITKYRIYVSVNGRAYSATNEYSSSTTVINGRTYYYYDVRGSSGVDRGDYQTYKIQSIGTYSNSNQSSAVSPRLYKNRLPSAPVGYVRTVSSSVTGATLSYTAGSDADGQSVKTYYSTSTSGTKYEYTGGNLNLGTYYIWSYDGLEYSETYGTAIIRGDTASPEVTNFNVSTTTFIPYYNNPNYKYVTEIRFTSVTAVQGGYSNINRYNYYYAQSSSSSISTSNSQLITTSTSPPSLSSPITISVNNTVTQGYYFKIGVSVTTSLNETSEILWDSDIYCCGKPITALEFSPSIAIYSLIDNERGLVTDIEGLADYFDHYIRMTWNNPSISTSPYFGIEAIECGVVGGSGFNFTPYIIHKNNGDIFVPSCARGDHNVGYLLMTTVPRGTTVRPAIRVTPEYGTSFIVNSNVTKTRVNALAFSGSYNASPITWNFFSDEISNISFDGNKILGDAGFAKIKSVSIKNSKITTSYSGSYTTDSSSTPGHISFISGSFTNFKSALKNLNLDSLINSIYTITVTDRYGNVASTTITQYIDFRVAPSWTNANLSTSVEYLTSSSGQYTLINNTNITNINQRILNPGETIRLSWDSAVDSGNGDSNSIQYKISCYTKEETSTLNNSGGSLFFTTITSSLNFDYVIPFGSIGVKSIYFEIEALDQSGLYAANSLKTSLEQVLAVGRAVAPSFDISSYQISETGQLTGSIKINDYGDSRSINSSWTNYDRLGELVLTIRTDEDWKNLLYDSSFSFIDNGYATSGKINLSFALYPPYLSDLINIKSYIFSFDGPTFSYRNHQIGINIQADSESDTALIVSGSPSSGKNKIKFITTKPGWDDLYINLEESKIYNLIIDCGEW